jgi:hypothetical protein
MVGVMVGPTMTPTMGLPRAGGRPSRPARVARTGDRRAITCRPATGPGHRCTDGSRPGRDRRLRSARDGPAQEKIRNPRAGCAASPAQLDCAGSSGRLRSPIAQRRSEVAQSAAQSLSARAEGAVVGPTISPTMAARRLRCRIVTDGRGSWPSAWSGSAGELTTWNTRTPPRPGPPAAPPRRARRAAVGTARGMRRGNGGEPLRGGHPPGRHGGRSVHPDRQRAVP